MRKAVTLQVAGLALAIGILGLADAPSASAATCFSLSFSGGGLNGTGSPCTANTIYTNTPDPTSNSAPNLQDQTLNGSPLLASLTGPGTLDGFTVTATTSSTGTWTFTPAPGALFPQYIEISAGGDWFFTQVAIGTLSGSWSTCPSASLCLENAQGVPLGLSHIAFFDEGAIGGGGAGGTPLPSALALMGTVLAGGAGFGAWRRRSKSRE
jgi:hypothetical protein